MRVPLLAAAVLGLAVSSSALAEGNDALVAACIAETHAPGSYVVTSTSGTPRVTPAQGATQRGAAHVNDCLLDKFQVQFGKRVTYAPVAQQANTIVGETDCRRLRNRRITGSIAAAAGFALGLGDSVNAGVAVGAALGIGTTAAVAGRQYRACVSGSRPARNVVASTCAGGHPLKGGTGYCR